MTDVPCTRHQARGTQDTRISAPVDMLEGYFAHPTSKGSPIERCNLGDVLRELKRDGLLQCRRFAALKQARYGEPEQTQTVHRIPASYTLRFRVWGLGVAFWLRLSDCLAFFFRGVVQIQKTYNCRDYCKGQHQGQHQGSRKPMITVSVTIRAKL